MSDRLSRSIFVLCFSLIDLLLVVEGKDNSPDRDEEEANCDGVGSNGPEVSVVQLDKAYEILLAHRS